jgi:hypothetical protein
MRSPVEDGLRSRQIGSAGTVFSSVDVNKVSKLMSSVGHHAIGTDRVDEFVFGNLVDPRGFEPLTF